MKSDLTEVQQHIRQICSELGNFLIEKNRSYGNSAIEPSRIFSKASPREQILVRIDDKLSRIAKGNDFGEDVITDLLGYLVLLKVLDRIEGAKLLRVSGVPYAVSPKDLNKSLSQQLRHFLSNGDEAPNEKTKAQASSCSIALPAITEELIDQFYPWLIADDGDGCTWNQAAVDFSRALKGECLRRAEESK